ncbi:MAG TPA: hypothetical protein VGL92_11970, partial [Acidimicrobiia bacterium]
MTTTTLDQSTVDQFRALTGDEAPSQSRGRLLPAGVLGGAALALDAVALVLAARGGLEASGAVHSALGALWAVTGMALVARRPLRSLGVLTSAAALACAGAFAADAAVSAGWAGTGLTAADGVRCLLGALVPAA